MYSKRSARIAIFLFSLLLSASGLSETMYDTTTGQLLIPVLTVNGGQSYSATFSRISTDPLVWGLDSATPVSVNSRTAASYQTDAGTLTVREIYVDGQLFNLGFNVSDDCGAQVCLVPQLESLEDLGRAGSAIYTSVASTGSTFTCATCHAISEEDGFAADGFRRPGHPLLNATRRSEFKNGELSELLDAVNICRTEWMNTTAWDETDQEWLNLRNWLDDQATEDTSAAIVMEIVSPPEDVSGGDEASGRELLNTRCVVCHGDDGTGTERAPNIKGIGLQGTYIAARVRSSGRVGSAVYPGLTGGIMPFWGADRLSDAELVDIIAYLESGEINPVNTGNNGGSDPGASTCTNTHANVGLSATLTSRFHNVSGVATIIDDCTIQLTQFNYDGGGIDVQVYAGKDLQFLPSQGGFSIKSGLLGTAYNNGTLTITLPDGVTLDDFDSISIWCVPVGQSFGDVDFVSISVPTIDNEY